MPSSQPLLATLRYADGSPWVIVVTSVKSTSGTNLREKSSPLEATVEVLLILVVFFLHAGWAAPDVNETHYLCKAKNYWNPGWASGDFFLESADAHAIFYWTFGWLTRWMELPTLAWTGRVITWLALAWSWRRLSWAIVPRPLVSVLTGALLVTLIDNTHMAGEWLVGGFEAKSLAYVYVFLALEAAVRAHWRIVWPLLGVASSFHPLVGGWSVIAAGFAWWWIGDTRPPLRQMLPWLFMGFLLALPGLYFSLRLTIGVDSAIVREANEIYMYKRLPHHLAVWRFAWWYRLRHIAAAVIFLVLCWAWKSDRQDVLRGFVVGSLVISVVGAMLSILHLFDREITATVLRYYWYRLGDVAVAMGLAVMIGDAVVQLEARRRAWSVTILMLALGFSGWHLAQHSIVMHERKIARSELNISRARSVEMSHERLLDWMDACDWVATNTQPGDLFLTPRMNQTFKWRTGRPEVVTHKDVPQDAEGIAEWWRRIDDVYRYQLPEGRRKWRRNIAEQGQEKIEELGWKYGAKYALVPGRYPIDIRRIGMTSAYVNNSFTIYKLPPKGTQQ